MKELNANQIKEVSAGYTPITMEFYVSAASTDQELEELASFIYYSTTNNSYASYQDCLLDLKTERLECELNDSFWSTNTTLYTIGTSLL